MGIPSKNADLYRRFKFYGFGFLMGLLLVSAIFKGRGCKMPGSLKSEELAYQKLEISEHDKCMLQCDSKTEADIKQLIKTGKINYDESNVHAKPYALYVIEGKDAKGIPEKITIEDHDTISVFKSIVLSSDIQEKPCDCK